MFGKVKKGKLEVALPQMILGCTADKIRMAPPDFRSIRHSGREVVSRAFIPK
jgi:hypothetical protein